MRCLETRIKPHFFDFCFLPLITGTSVPANEGGPEQPIRSSSANPSRGWNDGLTGQFCRLYEPPQGMAAPSNTRRLVACQHPCLSVKRHKTVTRFALHASGIYALLILKMEVWQPKGVSFLCVTCGGSCGIVGKSKTYP
jgi:hypothetical protein